MKGKIFALVVVATALTSCQKESAKLSETQSVLSEKQENNVKKEKKEESKIQKESVKIALNVGGSVEKSGGFFDLANAIYPENIVVIDDEHFADAKAKRLAFTNAIASGEVDSAKLTEKSALILVSGTIDLSDGAVSDNDHSYFDEFDSETHKKIHSDFVYDIGSNKTILGVKNAKIAFGGLRIKARPTNTAQNIIIRNIVFWDAHGSTDYDTNVPEFSEKKASADHLSVEGSYAKNEYTTEFIPKNIWIDHCHFSDGVCVDLDRNYNHDGSLDVKAVHNMTVSWCEFTNHDKVSLIGSSDKFTEAKDRQITFHHNFYHGAVQRMPRARGCQIHLYNNVYDDIGTKNNSGYSLGPGIGSLFVVENNFFGAHQGKILRYYDKSTPDEPTFSRIFASGNSVEFNSKNAEVFEIHSVSEKPFEIQYKYTLDDVSEIFSNVQKNAGATLNLNVKSK